MAQWNETVSQRIQDAQAQNIADIRQNSDFRPPLAKKIILPLTTAATAANPYLINIPFDAFYVAGATDAVTSVNLNLGSDPSNTDYGSFPIRASDSAKLGRTIKGANLTWSAQSGKTLTLILFLGVDFKSGSYLNQFVGSTSIINGTSVVTGTLGAGGASNSVTVTNAAAVQLCPSNLVRADLVFYTDQEIWIGDAAVAVNRGTKIAAGSNFSFANTGTLYAIATGAAATVSGMELNN